jgi:hypothetical protein
MHGASHIKIITVSYPNTVDLIGEETMHYFNENSQSIGPIQGLTHNIASMWYTRTYASTLKYVNLEARYFTLSAVSLLHPHTVSAAGTADVIRKD